MRCRESSFEKCLQIGVNGLPCNLNGLGLQSVIQDFNGLWSKQGAGAFLYLFGSDFFLLMP